ncbi:MAG: serine/threonine protein kinase, partial [Bacteroidetes bacterium CG_4_8_14_3_um_filter_31_14]
MQQLILYLFIAIILLISVMGYFIYKAYKVKKEANRVLKQKNIEIMEQNEEIRQQKEEITAQRDEIETQKDEIVIQRNTAISQRDEITLQKKEIMDSILYARRIQTAVLPPSKFISQILPDHFFIYNKPRDIVSGDYYWMAQKDNKTIIAAADCTGHGVPGAFMSLLGVSFLKEIINKIDEIKANIILDMLRESVINALNQAGGENEGQTKDGMDMALCVLDFNISELQFAGANNPLYLI